MVWEMDLPLPEVMADKVTKGYLVRCGPDGGPYEPEAVETAVPEDPYRRPAANARKADWVGWAVRTHGLVPDDAEAKTVADLAALPDRPADRPQE